MGWFWRWISFLYEDFTSCHYWYILCFGVFVQFVSSYLSWHDLLHNFEHFFFRNRWSTKPYISKEYGLSHTHRCIQLCNCPQKRWCVYLSLHCIMAASPSCATTTRVSLSPVSHLLSLFSAFMMALSW